MRIERLIHQSIEFVFVCLSFFRRCAETKIVHRYPFVRSMIIIIIIIRGFGLFYNNNFTISVDFPLATGENKKQSPWSITSSLDVNSTAQHRPAQYHTYNNCTQTHKNVITKKCCNWLKILFALSVHLKLYV